MESSEIFYGYARNDGSLGVRNYLLILPVVQCVNEAARRASSQLSGSVTLETAYGCSQLGADAEQTFRTIRGFARNPNIGACVILGSSCAQIDGEAIASEAALDGRDVEYVNADNFPSLERAVAEIVHTGLPMALKLSSQRRTEAGVGAITLGLECGGSDAWSGLSANPATGECSDILISRGGTAVLSETQEMIGAEHIFAKRAASGGVREAFLRVVRYRELESIEGGVDISSVNPSPGNKVGGLTTLEEKSLGCLLKGGTKAPLVEVVDYAEAPTKRGLVFMDTPGDDVESITGMVAGGCQVVIFTTGRGACTGSPIAPVIKVASNTDVFRKMEDNIDFNAGSIVDGLSTIEEAGLALFDKMLRVCGGEATKSEILGCCGTFAITRAGITL
jgi:altronate dehydratase large subunit